jgi:hypothetical protein
MNAYQHLSVTRRVTAFMAKSQPTRDRSSFLTRIKAEKRWFSLASLLEAAVSEPHSFGFTHSEEVLATVAEARGQHPGALRGPIAARRFLVDNFAESATEDRVQCGYHVVQVLSAIHRINPAKAKVLATDVLAGKLATRPLRQIYRDITATEAPAAENRSGAVASTKRRTVAFARTVERFVRDNILLFCKDPNAELSDSPKIGPLAPDYLIVVNGSPRVAIETRIPGASVYRKQINETVGLCALTLMRVPEIWIIAPLSAERHLEKMAKVAMSFGLKGAHFACLDEGLAMSDPKGALKESKGDKPTR